MNSGRHEYIELVDLGYTKVYYTEEDARNEKYCFLPLPSHPSLNSVPLWFCHVHGDNDTFADMAIRNHGFTEEQQSEVIEYVKAHHNLSQ